ncbi:MAG: hypothetical protein KAR40_03215 [Candidatus Sabulitectum sp.]|nr:hypothetical protein [Candidatus Sabulitectum sp.]
MFPVLLVVASFLFPAITGRQSNWFGVNQINSVNLFNILQIFAIAGSFIAGCILLFRRDYWRIAGAILILFIMFVFRSNTLNPDGVDLLWKIPSDVDKVGAHVVHDEMLELYTHSLFWNTLNELGYFGVALSYQILSVLSGLLFMLLLVKYAKENIKSEQLLFVLLVSSGGFIQLFFGDVENYSITVAIVMWYFLVAARAANCKASLMTASLILGLAMCFHLEAGFLLPSLAYLIYKSPTREKPVLSLMIMLIPLVMVGICMVLFHLSGILPFENLWLYSHATAHGGNIASVLPPLTVPYYLEMLNLLILLFPSVLLLPPGLILAKSHLNRIDRFLITATGFLMLLPLAWKAALGVQNDWNLYAIVAVPGSLLVWSLWVQKPEIRWHKYLLITVLAFSMLNTFSWVVTNNAGRFH